MEAVMYLSDKRSKSQSATHRSLHTLNLTPDGHGFHGTFLSVTSFNDETLSPKAGVIYAAQCDQHILLLPVIGQIAFSIDSRDGSIVDVGQSALLVVKTGSILEITNPFEGEAVNFVSVWFEGIAGDDDNFSVDSFDVDREKNVLVQICSNQKFTGYVGKFSGRTDVQLKLKQTVNGVFVFVIEGAFEVQNRLLQQKDALSLTRVSAIEFEALSNDAIILVLELW